MSHVSIIKKKDAVISKLETARCDLDKRLAIEEFQNFLYLRGYSESDVKEHVKDILDIHALNQKAEKAPRFRIEKSFNGCKGADHATLLLVLDQYGTVWEDVQVSADAFKNTYWYRKAVDDRVRELKKEWNIQEDARVHSRQNVE